MGTFEAFVAEQHAGLVRAAYLLCGDAARAEDLVQDALVGAYKRWGRLEDPLPYVHRSIVNGRTSWWRRQRDVLVDPPDGPATGVDPDVTHDVRRALLALPPRQRAVVVLRFLTDLSVDETAAALACSPGTVKSQTHKALATLREHPALNTWEDA